MIYAATKKIIKAFEREGIKCRTNETERTSAVEAGYSGDNAPSFVVRFISTDDDNDVAVRIISFVKVPDNKRIAVLETINSLQRDYRFVRFTLDDDNDVNISYDMPVRTTDPGACAVEMFIRFANIADEAYPKLMKAIWS